MTKGKKNAEDHMTDGGPGRTDIGTWRRATQIDFTLLHEGDKPPQNPGPIVYTPSRVTPLHLHPAGGVS